MSEAERAAGVALIERHGDGPALAVDADGEPVAAAVHQADGAGELVGLLLAEPDLGRVGAVDVVGVVAGVRLQRAHVRLHLLTRSFLLGVLGRTADGDERERRQRESATTSRRRAR